MTWRYVAARENVAGEDVWTIRELYDDDGKLSWTGPIAPRGDTWLEMHDDLSRMGEGALDDPLAPAAVSHTAGLIAMSRVDLFTHSDSASIF